MTKYANLYAGEITISDQPEFIARSQETDIDTLMKVLVGDNDKNLYAAFENSATAIVAQGGSWYVTINGTFENEYGEDNLGFTWNRVFKTEALDSDQAIANVYEELKSNPISIIF
jgi:hypothetical protein